MKLLLLLLSPIFTFGQLQWTRSAGLVASPGNAYGISVGIHNQATDVWSAGLAMEASYTTSKKLPVALVLVNSFAAKWEGVLPVFNFSIGHTVAPAHGAYLETGVGLKGDRFSLLGMPVGKLVISAGYRACYMPLVESNPEDRGVELMKSGVVVRVGLEF